MDIVQATDRILVSIGIGMSAAFHLFRFSIMTLMPAIEDIKTDVLLEGLSYRRLLLQPPRHASGAWPPVAAYR